MSKIFVLILNFILCINIINSDDSLGCDNQSETLNYDDKILRVKRQFSLDSLISGTSNKFHGKLRLFLPSVKHPIGDDFKAEFSKTIDKHKDLSKMNNGVNKKSDINKQIRNSTKTQYEPIVSTAEGLVRGLTIDKGDIKYYSFLGMPYASKPERFQAAKILKPWNGIKDLFEEKPRCIQMDELELIGGNEDCLYLNIHTQTLEDKKLPVIIWIHGGLFQRGSGGIFYGPHKLMKQNIVLVSINYRLGALGYLSTGTKHAPGNAGMKDLVQGLRWVNQNIHMFGGDTYNICLYGVSSGGTMIEYMALSPLTKGLFSKIISHSGSTLTPWAYRPNPLKYAFKLGIQLGIDTINIEELMNQLKNETAESIIRATHNLEKSENPLGSFIPFVPCAEKIIPGEEAFLYDRPENILRSGNYTHVPMMIGFNDLEGAYFVKQIHDIPKFFNVINKIFEYVMPANSINHISSPLIKNSIIEKVQAFYFDNKPIDLKSMRNFMYFIGDTKFFYPVYKSLKYRMQNTRYPIYFFEFAYDAKISYLKDLNISGVGHAEDLAYVFEMPILENKINSNMTSIKVSQKMTTMFANFAKYGNPTPSTTDLIPIKWNPINGNETIDYLRITHKLEMRKNPYKNRTDFWTEIYNNNGL